MKKIITFLLVLAALVLILMHFGYIEPFCLDIPVHFYLFPTIVFIVKLVVGLSFIYTLVNIGRYYLNKEVSKREKIKKVTKKVFFFLFLPLLLLLGILNILIIPLISVDKPVIYLYPTEKTDVSVKLDYNGKLVASYPSYNEKIEGWDVIAYPDGKILNKEDGFEYNYLFWEGEQYEGFNIDRSEGFIVSGEDTVEFLREKLSEIGLEPREYNEFIVYWYPILKQNKFNYINFVGEEYTEVAKLKITPKPDSILRVYMAYKPLNKYVSINEQKLDSFQRKGFTVVEWGGGLIE